MRIVVAVLVVVVALVGHVQRAHACSCGPSFVIAPRPAATDVPLNPIIVFQYEPGIMGQLRDPTGATIPLDFEHISGNSRFDYFVARPTVPLAPNTRYEIVRYSDFQYFTTGTERDDTPLEPFALQAFQANGVEALKASPCGSCDGVGETSSFVVDYDRPVDAVFRTVEIYRQGDDASFRTPIYDRSIGNDYCGTALPALDLSATYCARVTAYDHAGNTTVSNERCASGRPLWCETDDDYPCNRASSCKPQSSGCNGGGARGGWFVVAIALLGCRRRRYEPDR